MILASPFGVPQADPRTLLGLGVTTAEQVLGGLGITTADPRRTLGAMSAERMPLFGAVTAERRQLAATVIPVASSSGFGRKAIIGVGIGLIVLGVIAFASRK